MKRFKYGFLFCVVFLCSMSASAQKRFGLGLVLGQPAGFSAKYWLDARNSIDGIVGVDFGRHGGVSLVCDWAHHWADLTPVPSGRFLLGAGAGAFAGLGGNDSEVGVRVKVLADYLFAPAPVNLFLEIAPAIEMSDPDFTAHAGLGVRWFF